MSEHHDKRISALVDAAFRELQHDTGETNPEYLHSKRVLEQQFRKILRYPKAPTTQPKS